MLLSDEIIGKIENPKEMVKKLLGITNEANMNNGYMINMWIKKYFYTLERNKWEIKFKMPFSKAAKNYQIPRE